MVTLYAAGHAGEGTGQAQQGEKLSVPLDVYQKVFVQTNAADAHATRILERRKDSQASAMGGCCLTAPTGGGTTARVTERVADNPVRLRENKCLLCPYARGLCAPGGLQHPEALAEARDDNADADEVTQPDYPGVRGA